MLIGIRHLIRSALFAIAFKIVSSSGLADTISWIKSTDGNWAETNGWSLGRLPSESDAVTLNNAPATITIDSSTVLTAPSSLNVSNMTISKNTLFLNNVGDAGFHVGRMTLNGNGHFIQDGGSSDFGGIFLSSYSIFARTNTVVTIGGLGGVDGTSIQVGGTTTIHAMSCNGGSNIVENGLLHVDGSLLCLANEWPITFIQKGGRTETGPLTMMGALYGYSVLYSLEKNGTLVTGDTYLGTRGVFRNISGNHVINGNLVIQGGLQGHYSASPLYGEYDCAGTLTARNLTLDQSQGFSHFDAAGEVHIAQDISFSGNPDFQSTFSISGLVTCSNLRSQDTDIDIIQTSGAFIVSNVFSFNGRYSGYYYDHHGARPSLYWFTGGTFTANDIKLDSEWIIQSSNTAFRITNPGTFTLGGLIHLIDGTEHLGRFTLASNAVVDLGGASADLSFENSSAETWNSAATLTVSNWNGSLSGGGVDRLAFGADSTGLNESQLSHIRFVRPEGLADGIYDAQMLPTGEVVPSALVASLPPPNSQTNSPPPTTPPPTTPPPTTPPPTTPPPTNTPPVVVPPITTTNTPPPSPQGGQIFGSEKFQATIRLIPTQQAPRGATGTLTINANNRNGTNVANLKITLRNITNNCTVAVTLKSDGSTIPVGELNGSYKGRGVAVSQYSLTLPDTISAMDISTVTISDEFGVMLVGDVVNAAGNSLTVLNGHVNVVSTNANLRGTAILNTHAYRGKHGGTLTMTVSGLAPNTAYHVLANGNDVAIVTSTKQGRLVIRRLPGTDLRVVSSVQLQDPDGNIVAEAFF